MSSKNKRVLFINSVLGLGSTGKIVCQLAEGVESSGGEAFVCYGRNDYNGDIKGKRFITDKECKINGVFSRLLDNEGLGLSYPTKRLVKIIQEFKPDIIHLHNIHGYYLNYKVLFNYLKTTNIKVIWTLHDCWTFTGHCAYFDYANCDKWKTQCEHCPNKKTYPKSLILDRSKHQYNKKKEYFNLLDAGQITFVSPSEWLAKLCKSSFLNKYDVRVINNGVVLDNFKPTHTDNLSNLIKKDKKIILALANIWEPRKGPNDVNRMAHLLGDEYQVLMVGKQVGKIENLSPNITIIDKKMDQKQLAELYTKALVFVNTTYEDNFPTTNIESLSCGTPIITYKTGGSVEVINDHNGYIVNKGDVDKVVGVIKGLQEDTFNRENISKEAHELYNNELMVSKYLSLYEE